MSESGEPTDTRPGFSLRDLKYDTTNREPGWNFLHLSQNKEHLVDGSRCLLLHILNSAEVRTSLAHSHSRITLSFDAWFSPNHASLLGIVVTLLFHLTWEPCLSIAGMSAHGQAYPLVARHGTNERFNAVFRKIRFFSAFLRAVTSQPSSSIHVPIVVITVELKVSGRSETIDVSL
jgi:hypothetical protein